MPDRGDATLLPARVRADFPILSRRVGDYPLAYLDSANTSHKPQAVIDAIATHYAEHNANVARAMHMLGAEATAGFEGGRAKVATFVGATRPEEVVFTKNASEALNLAAHTLGQHLGIGPGDEIVISVLEHHSNIVPWQLLCQRTGATLRWFDVTEEGRLDLAKADAEGLINEATKIVSLAWVSNVLGTVNPVADLVAIHSGGGGYAGWMQSAGVTIVADGRPETAVRLRRSLDADTGLGVLRHASAGYDEAAASVASGGETGAAPLTWLRASPPEAPH